MTTRNDDDWTRSPARPIAATIILTLTGTTLAALAPIAEPNQPTATAVTRPIDLNTDPADVLQLLPNVGPKLAQAIVSNRLANGPFDSLDDLQRVSGIGPRTVIAIETYAAASSPD